MDFSLIFANKILAVTTILAVPAWLIAFVGQAAAEANDNGHLGRSWFGIFVQLFVILGVAVTLATDSIGMVRLQLSAWIVVALVFAVSAIDQGIYSRTASYEAMAAGYFILTIVDVIWLFFFTSEEGSPIFNFFHSVGGGGGFSSGGFGGRRTRVQGVRGGPGAMRMAGSNSSATGNGTAFSGGYGGGGGGSAAYQPAYGQSPSTADVTHSSKAQRGGLGAASLAASDRGGHTTLSVDQHRNISPQASSTGLASAPVGGAGSGVEGAGAGSTASNFASAVASNGGSGGAGDSLSGYGYKARALYAYTASPDDPTEISFVKGEILSIVDNTGKWWQAKKENGETGIVPSNYMQLL